LFVFATLFLIPSSNLVSAPSVTSVYWSEDDGTGEIFSADLATQTVTQITSGGFDRIDDVELNALNAKLWWNNWDPGTPSATEGLWESNLDGTGQMQRLSGLQNSCAGAGELQTSGLTGIVLDPANQQVFYTRGVSYANCPNGEVSRVNMDGTGYTILDNIVGGDSWHPDGIELVGNTIYWGDPGIIAAPVPGAVNSMDTNGGGQIANLVPHTDFHGRSIAVDAADGLLFYSAHDRLSRGTGGAIFVFDINAGGAPTNVLNDPTTGIADVELDAANNRIYWTDYANGQIRSASYDAAGNLGAITNEITGLTNPYGLALRFLTQGVGGEYFTLDTTALLVAGLQTNLAWIIPVAVSTVGIGAFLLRKKF